MQEKEMTPKERKCGNCAARISTHPKPECGDAYCRAPGRPETTICDEDSGCPDHRSAAEQATRWEARAARERLALHDFASIQDEGESAGRADEQRAIVAWLRWFAEVAFGAGLPAQEADSLRGVADRIEAGEHRVVKS